MILPLRTIARRLLHGRRTSVGVILDEFHPSVRAVVAEELDRLVELDMYYPPVGPFKGMRGQYTARIGWRGYSDAELDRRRDAHLANVHRVLVEVDVEFMPRWSTRAGERYPKPTNEPPRKAKVRVVLSEGLYGYELEHGGEVLREFYGGESWRDRETAIALCESRAHERTTREIGPVKTWSRRDPRGF